MFYDAPTEQDIHDAKAHVATLTRKRELCAKLNVLKSQVAEIERELGEMPTHYRRPGVFERAHRRFGLA